MASRTNLRLLKTFLKKVFQPLLSWKVSKLGCVLVEGTFWQMMLNCITNSNDAVKASALTSKWHLCKSALPAAAHSTASLRAAQASVCLSFTAWQWAGCLTAEIPVSSTSQRTPPCQWDDHSKDRAQRKLWNRWPHPTCPTLPQSSTLS